jgi:RNase P subunit RPR2
MLCEKCQGLMIERPPILDRDDAEEKTVVLECIECGHIEYQPLITSFWRRLAA